LGTTRHIWHTAVGRSYFAFRSALHSADAPFFLSVEHLQGLVEQRRKVQRTATIFFFFAIALSFALLLRSTNLIITIDTPFGEVRGIPISNNFLLFALSVCTAYYVINLLNHMLVNKQIQAVFEHAGLPATEAMSRAAYAAARWSAEELWIDLLAPRPMGFRSGVVHWILVLVSLLLLIGIAVSQISLILFAAYAGLEQASRGDQFSYLLIAVPSVVAIHFAIFGAVAVMCLPMKFKWQAELRGAVPGAVDPPAVGQTPKA
jgi:hypothetical protein